MVATKAEKKHLTSFPLYSKKRKRRDKDTGIFPIDTECKNVHQQDSKNYTTFFPPAFRAKSDSMCHVYPVEDWNSFKSDHTRNMTPSYTSLLGTNSWPQPSYKSAEYWNFSYLLVFRSCYEGELQSLASREKKWTLKGNFVKIQDLRLKHVA